MSDQDALPLSLIRQCISCGLCLSSCPTYRETGTEMASPRGRIAMMRAIALGEMGMSERFDYQMHFCLTCRACETACPSGVHYGELVELARAKVAQAAPRSAKQQFQRFVLDGIIARPERLRLLARLMRFYQRSGLRWVARESGLLQCLPGHLGELEDLLPPVPARAFSKIVSSTYEPYGARRARVGMLRGCIADVLLVEANLATLEVLRHNGCQVIVPPDQVCCGALHIHQGDREGGRGLAKQNIEAFESAEVDFIVVNVAGCGSSMKEYGLLFRGDPEWAERAGRFASKVRDVSEVVVELGLNTADLGPFPARVTYDDPCHLIHGQKISVQPRQILQAIPGLELVPLPEADWCCGSAGVYNVLHFETSMSLLKRKMEAIASTGAEVVATGNAGCLLQIDYGRRRFGPSHVRVLHPVQILAEAYLAGPSPTVAGFGPRRREPAGGTPIAGGSV